nr:Maf family protein [Candidatus Krumholzibacteria bacterium]
MTVTPFVPWPTGRQLILASRSPRRAQLLEIAGLPHRIELPGDVERELAARLLAEDAEPGRYAELLAAAKAKDVSSRLPDQLVLGADTVVVLDRQILEKPVDEADAERLLGLLSGRRHTVITAIALFGGPAGRGLAAHERTEVDFLPLTPGSIAAYVRSGEPMDKAGAYGIQGLGALMVQGVQGCYFNVMGLPLARLGSMLRQLLPAQHGGA